MTLGENIARLRTQKDWSQGDLADALGISRQRHFQMGDRHLDPRTGKAHKALGAFRRDT